MLIKFECKLKKDNKTEKKWYAEFESIRIYRGYIEFVILSQNIIHVIIGESFRGMLASLPDYKVCCLIYNFKDRFNNFESLSKVLIDIDAATVESALFYIGEHYIKSKIDISL